MNGVWLHIYLNKRGNMRVLPIMVLVVAACPAFADCPIGQEEFMSCNIENSKNVLSVCFDDTNAYYSFGPQGRSPDLALSEPIEMIDYTPWPGVGRAIWESLTFRNDEYSYTVVAGFDRMFGDETEEDHPTPHFGEVQVKRDGETLVNLSCERGRTAFAWTPDIYEAKEAAGYEWDDRNQLWFKTQE